MGLNHSPRIVTDGLVLCLDAANRKSYPGSGTTWTDLSGNGNSGTLTNGPTYSSNNAGSIVFDGTNDYVGVTTSSTLGKSLNYTTLAWVRYSNVGYISWMMICDSVDYGSGGGYMMWLDSASPTTGKRLSSYDGNWQHANILIPPNVWTHVSISKANNQVSFYVNGIFDVTRTYNFNANLSSTNVDIGNSSRNSYPFNGSISAVQIYNRALSASEVQQNFNALRGRYGL
jgi:hypothetical protein